ncbi:MAG TPA: HisA/HisF-related TIM barrel protein [Longimicrobiales bacterium]
MLRKRIIVCLDVKAGRVVNGIQSGALRDAGDPVELAARFEADGADEIVLMDVGATPEDRTPLLAAVRQAADRLQIPVTVAGGIGDVDDIGRALRAGASKVSINTAAILRPDLIADAVQRYGSACIVASLEARRERRQIEIMARPDTGSPDVASAASLHYWFRVFTHGGASATQLDAIAWARSCADMGAGELTITSIDRQGGRNGYDLELTARIVEAVQVPVVASGGAGRAEHIRDVFLLAGADAALASVMFQDGSTSVHAVKQMLRRSGIAVRNAQEEQPRMAQ